MDRKTFIIVNGLNPGEGLLSVIDTVLEEDLIRVESEGSNEDLSAESVTQQRTKTKHKRYHPSKEYLFPFLGLDFNIQLCLNKNGSQRSTETGQIFQ